jgi:type II secretory pathway pseudopilin PulG
LGILAAIAIPRFIDVRSGAETAAKEANARVLTSASQLYFANEGAYPGTNAATAITALNGANLIDSAEFNAGDYTYTPASGTWTHP